MKKTPLRSRSAPLRSREPARDGGIARKTRVKPMNAKRRAKNHARAYGGEDRILWLQSQPCWHCGYVGASEAAHIRTGGMSRKADARLTIPLCGWHPVGFKFADSCHATQHAYGWSALPSLDTRAKREAAAARTEAAWQSHLRQTGHAREDTE